MGVIGKVMGGPAAVTALAGAAREVAEVFTPNATRSMELSAEAQTSARAQHGAEFEGAGLSLFDSFMNGLNRMPRPMLAFGTLGLFAYAMIDPARFAERMVGLNEVPEPLWWLLGAVVGFYFGAREAHYFRTRSARPRTPAPVPETGDPNPALDAWRQADTE
jgi:hypothetical protein